MVSMAYDPLEGSNMMFNSLGKTEPDWNVNDLVSVKLEPDAEEPDNHYFEHAFECFFCEISFEDNASLDDHIESNHVAKPGHMCKVCGLWFFSVRGRFLHLATVHNDPEARCKCPDRSAAVGRVAKKSGFGWDYSCRPCNRNFYLAVDLSKSNRALRKKYRTKKLKKSKEPKPQAKRDRIKKTHLCDHCGRSYREKLDLTEHVWIFHEKKTMNYQCATCGEYFPRKLKLKEHVKIEHTDSAGEQCDVCGKVLRTPRELTLHRRTHKQLEPAPCPQCPKVFAFRQRLVAHMESMHPDESWPFECGQCRRRFPAESRLHQHVKRAHNKDKARVECGRCDKSFTNRTTRDAHIAAVHENASFACDLCDRVYNRARTLEDHKKFVHMGVERKVQRCELCSFVSTNSTRLASHVRHVHGNVRDHKCPECDKPFKSKQAVKYHLKAAHKITDAVL